MFNVDFKYQVHYIKLILFSGSSAVRLAHHAWDVGVAGSNPVSPMRL